MQPCQLFCNNINKIRIMLTHLIPVTPSAVLFLFLSLLRSGLTRHHFIGSTSAEGWRWRADDRPSPTARQRAASGAILRPALRHRAGVRRLVKRQNKKSLQRRLTVKSSTSAFGALSQFTSF